jgi:hypothetical protein
VTWAFARAGTIALLVAAVLAPPAASATDVRIGTSAFCDAAAQVRQEYIEAEGFSLRHKADVRALQRLVDGLSADAPSVLQPSFRTLQRFYDRILANEIALVGGTDEARDRYDPAAKRAGRASLVIARYLRNRCGILL